jgi:hypothetical protein
VSFYNDSVTRINIRNISLVRAKHLEGRGVHDNAFVPGSGVFHKIRFLGGAIRTRGSDFATCCALRLSVRRVGKKENNIVIGEEEEGPFLQSSVLVVCPTDIRKDGRTSRVCS